MARNADMEFRIDANVTGIPSLQQAERAVKSLDGQMRRSGVVANQFGGALGGVGKDIRKSILGGVQQAGYQFGDFAVQVGNGTSAIQAFGQQGAQLLGIFGPIGAVLGAGVAVISAIAVAAQRSSKAAKELKEDVVSVSAALQMLERDTGITTKSISDMISREFGAASMAVNEFFMQTEKRDVTVLQRAVAAALPADALRQLSRLRQEIGDSQEALDKIRKDILAKGGFIPPIAFAGPMASITKITLDLKDLEEEFGIGAEKADILISNLNAVNLAANRKELISALAALRKTVSEIDSEPARQLHQELVQLAMDNNLFQPVIDRAKDLEEKIGEAKAAALDLNKVIFDPRDPNFDPVIAEFARLQLGIEAAREEDEKRNESSLERVLWVQREEQLMQQVVGLNQTSLEIERQRKENLAQLVANQASMAQIMMSVSADPEERLMARGVGIDSDALAKAREFFAELERNAKEAAKIGDPLGDLTKRISAERELLRATDAERQVRMAIYDADRKYSPEMVQNAINLVEGYQLEVKALEEVKAANEAVANTIENSMTDAFMSIVDGTKKPIEAFKDMARLIIAELYKVLVVKQLVGSIEAGTGLSSALYSGLGFRARGGPITAGKPYMVGERGPELIVPSRNASVIPNNQLSGGGVTVIQNNTFGNGVNRAEVQAMLPRIIETTKAAVFDAQRRSVNGLGYA